MVGFIGPEYLFDGKQITRAGLEDHFCGKLLGLPMGCDVCYTNHAEADQDDMDALLALLVAAGVNFVMGVPGADDIMLGYQSTSFHDALAMRELFGRRPAPEFEAWLAAQGLLDGAGRVRPPALPGRLQALLPAGVSDWAAAAAPHRRPDRPATAPAPRSARGRCSNSAWPMPAPATPCTPSSTRPRSRLPALLVASQAAGPPHLPDAPRSRPRPASRQRRAARRPRGPYDLAIILGDGLSAEALHRHAAAAAGRAAARAASGWSLAPLVVARHARVALGDRVAEALGAARRPDADRRAALAFPPRTVSAPI